MQSDLFNKTAEEAVDILAARYVEVQAGRRDYIKKADGENDKGGMSQEVAHALVGGAVGAGLGGLGSLGYNYLKGKKQRLKDVLYGSLMGAIPGASLGYLASPSADTNKPNNNSNNNKGSWFGAAAANTLIPGGAAVVGGKYLTPAGFITGKSPEQIRIANELKKALDAPDHAPGPWAPGYDPPRNPIKGQIPGLRKGLDAAAETAAKLPERNILTNPFTGDKLFDKNINANMTRRAARVAGGLGWAALLHNWMGSKAPESR